MKVIDLTHIINEDIPVFSCKEKPVINQVFNVDRDGFSELEVTFYTHTGTHIDAPYHALSNGRKLDEFPPDKFIGRAVVADCRNLSSPHITPDDLMPYKEDLMQSDFLILHTGWSHKWGYNSYVKNFPTLTPETAYWLKQFNLNGIGMDTISIDPVEENRLPVHKIVLGDEILIIENLTKLEEVQGHSFTLSCFPLKLENADGSPVRAIAMIP